VFAIGRPMGTLAPTSSALPKLWQQVNVVFSVGPYPLISRQPGNFRNACRTCAADNTSPPASNCFSPRKLSPAVSIIW
jgi:hypothetical protein